MRLICLVGNCLPLFFCFFLDFLSFTLLGFNLLLLTSYNPLTFFFLYVNHQFFPDLFAQLISCPDILTAINQTLSRSISILFKLLFERHFTMRVRLSPKLYLLDILDFTCLAFFIIFLWSPFSASYGIHVLLLASYCDFFFLLFISDGIDLRNHFSCHFPVSILYLCLISLVGKVSAYLAGATMSISVPSNT